MHNSKLLVAAALLAATASAQAADLPVKAPVYKAAVTQVYDWTGFYIGVNAGGSVGRSRTNTFGPTPN
jgi:outer membrane immunogenic protein